MATVFRTLCAPKAAGTVPLYLIAWVITGFIPVFPLFQGRVLIGRIPLFAAWWMWQWPQMGLHLLLAASITAIAVIGWRLAGNRWRFSLKTLLLLMTLIATAVVIYVALTSPMTFRNGSQLPPRVSRIGAGI